MLTLNSSVHNILHVELVFYPTPTPQKSTIIYIGNFSRASPPDLQGGGGRILAKRFALSFLVSEGFLVARRRIEDFVPYPGRTSYSVIERSGR